MCLISFCCCCRGSGAPKSAEEWLQLLDQQQHLHQLQMERWREILSASITLMDHMKTTLNELYHSIDKHGGGGKGGGGGGGPAAASSSSSTPAAAAAKKYSEKLNTPTKTPPVT